jgi:hypothetical protein
MGPHSTDERRRFSRLAGWLPAIILPAATAEQIRALLTADSAAGTSALTWFLFLLANLGAMFLGIPATRIARVQIALAFGLTAVLDVLLIVLVLVR